MRSPDKHQSLRVLRDRGVPVETIIDVGVLYGTPELIETYPDKLHVLFEPVAEFNRAIEARYASIPHVLENLAVSDADGETRLELRSIIPGMDISHSNIARSDAVEDGRRYRTVPMTTLDSYFAARPQPGPFFFKLDVDGFEMPILQGARETLRNSSVVMVETPKHQFVERIRFVEAAGFELYDLAEPCYYDSSFWQCDAIFLRRDVHRQYFAQLMSNFDPAKYTKFAMQSTG